MCDCNRRLNLSKSPEIQPSKQVDIAQYLETSSLRILKIIEGCYYNNGSQVGQSRAYQTLEQIRGEMLAMQSLVRSIQ